MKKSLLFISCEEAKQICDKSQYGEATTWERLKLSLRLSWCKITRAYSTRNKKLTKAMKNSEIDCLQNKEKAKLKEAFECELNNHQ